MILEFLSVFDGVIIFLVDFFDVSIIKICGMFCLEVILNSFFFISFSFLLMLVFFFKYCILFIVFLIFFLLKYVLKFNIIWELVENIIKLIWVCRWLIINILMMVLVIVILVLKCFCFFLFLFFDVLIRNVKLILFLYILRFNDGKGI